MKSDAELIEIMRQQIGRERGAAARWGERYHVDASVISNLLSGRRTTISARIARVLGYKRVYVRIRDAN